MILNIFPRKLSLFVAIVFLICTLISGCAGLPPRYEEPLLPEQEVATITATGEGIGILNVDGKVPCAEADYNEKGLRRMAAPTKVLALPGPHELTLYCWWDGGYTIISTNIVVSAGKRYIVSRRFSGYSFSLSFEPESK